MRVRALSSLLVEFACLLASVMPLVFSTCRRPSVAPSSALRRAVAPSSPLRRAVPPPPPLRREVPPLPPLHRAVPPPPPLRRAVPLLPRGSFPGCVWEMIKNAARDRVCCGKMKEEGEEKPRRLPRGGALCLGKCLLWWCARVLFAFIFGLSRMDGWARLANA